MANLGTSTASYATRQQTGQTVFIWQDGTAAVLWSNGSNQLFSYSAAPYSTWTNITIVTGQQMALAGYMDANGNINVVTGTASTAKPQYYPFTRTSNPAGGSAWTLGTPVLIDGSNNCLTSAVGNVANYAGQDPLGRHWVFAGGASTYIQRNAWYSPTNNPSGAWTRSITGAAQTADINSPAGGLVANYAMEVFWNGTTGFSYRRNDASVATMAGWGGASAVANTQPVTVTSNFAFKHIGNGLGCLIYTTASGIYAQIYTASTDTWSTATALSAGANDTNPDVIPTLAGECIVVWSSYAAANSYALVFKGYQNGVWDTATTQLVASGANNVNANGGFDLITGTLGVVYTTGTATPWTVGWVTQSLLQKRNAVGRIYEVNDWDDFNRANASSWGTTKKGGTWTQDTNTWTVSITSNQATAAGVASQEWHMMDALTFPNQNVSVQVEGHVGASTQEHGVAARRQATNTWYRATLSGVGLFRLSKSVAGAAAFIGNSLTLPGYSIANTYTVKLSCVGSVILGKAWQTGTAEPTSYQLQATDTGIVGAGQAGIICYNGTGTITLDNFKVYDAGPTEYKAPGRMNLAVSGHPSPGNTKLQAIGRLKFVGQYEATVLADGADAYYRVNEGSGSIAHDYTGHGNDGYVASGVNWVQDTSLIRDYPKGAAYGQKNANTYIQVPSTLNYNRASAFSVEAFFKFVNTVSGNYETILATSAPRGNNVGYQLYVQNTPNATFTFDVGNGTTYGRAAWNPGASTVLSLTLGKWYHIVGTFDGSNVRLYVNGLLMQTTALVGTVGYSIYPVTLMKEPSGTNDYSNHYDEEIAFYPIALTQAQIQNHLRLASGLYDFDEWQRANFTSGWGVTPSSNNWGVTGTLSYYSVTNGVAAITTTAGGSYFMYRTPTGLPNNSSFVGDVKFSSASSSGGIVLCYTDANNHYRLVISSSGVLQWQKTVTGSSSFLGPTYTIPSFNIANTYTLRGTIYNGVLYGRVWQAGTAEPDAYNVAVADSSFTSGAQGYYFYPGVATSVSMSVDNAYHYDAALYAPVAATRNATGRLIYGMGGGLHTGNAIGRLNVGIQVQRNALARLILGLIVLRNGMGRFRLGVRTIYNALGRMKYVTRTVKNGLGRLRLGVVALRNGMARVTISVRTVLNGRGRINYVVRNVKNAVGRLKFFPQVTRNAMGHLRFGVRQVRNGLGRVKFFGQTVKNGVGRLKFFPQVTRNGLGRIIVRGRTVRNGLGRLRLGIVALRNPMGRLRLGVVSRSNAVGRENVAVRVVRNAIGRFKYITSSIWNGTGRMTLAVPVLRNSMGRTILSILSVRNVVGRMKFGLIFTHLGNALGRLRLINNGTVISYDAWARPNDVNGWGGGANDSGGGTPDFNWIRHSNSGTGVNGMPMALNSQVISQQGALTGNTANFNGEGYLLNYNAAGTSPQTKDRMQFLMAVKSSYANAQVGIVCRMQYYPNLNSAGMAQNYYRVVLNGTGAASLGKINAHDGWNGSVLGNLATYNVASYNAANFYWVRFVISGTTNIRLQANIWPVGTTEPAGWQIDYTDSSLPLNGGNDPYGILFYPGQTPPIPSNPIIAYFSIMDVGYDKTVLPTMDYFQRTNQHGWGYNFENRRWIFTKAINNDSLGSLNCDYSINGNLGQLSKGSTVDAGHQIAILGQEMHPADIGVQADIKIQANTNLCGVVARYQIYSGYYRATIGSAGTLRLATPAAFLGSTYTIPGFSVANTYTVMLSCQGNTIRAAVWQAGTTPPSGWHIVVTDSTYAAGGMCGVQHYATTLTDTATYDNFIIGPPGMLAKRNAAGRLGFFVGHVTTRNAAARLNMAVRDVLEGMGRFILSLLVIRNGLGRLKFAVQTLKSGMGRVILSIVARRNSVGRLNYVYQSTKNSAGRIRVSIITHRNGMGRVKFYGRTIRNGLGRVYLGVRSVRNGLGRMNVRGISLRNAKGRMQFGMSSYFSTRNGLGRLKYVYTSTRSGMSRVVVGIRSTRNGLGRMKYVWTATRNGIGHLRLGVKIERHGMGRLKLILPAVSRNSLGRLKFVTRVIKNSMGRVKLGILSKYRASGRMAFANRRVFNVLGLLNVNSLKVMHGVGRLKFALQHGSTLNASGRLKIVQRITTLKNAVGRVSVSLQTRIHASGRLRLAGQQRKRSLGRIKIVVLLIRSGVGRVKLVVQVRRRGMGRLRLALLMRRRGVGRMVVRGRTVKNAYGYMSFASRLLRNSKGRLKFVYPKVYTATGRMVLVVGYVDAKFLLADNSAEFAVPGQTALLQVPDNSVEYKVTDNTVNLVTSDNSVDFKVIGVEP